MHKLLKVMIQPQKWLCTGDRVLVRRSMLPSPVHYGIQGHTVDPKEAVPGRKRQFLGGPAEGAA